MEYPNVAEIRKGLMDRVGGGGSRLDVRMALLNHGLKVCDEAEISHACVVSGSPLPNVEAMIVLRFIEKVLNG